MVQEKKYQVSTIKCQTRLHIFRREFNRQARHLRVPYSPYAHLPSSFSRGKVRRNEGLSGYRACSAGRRAWRRTLIPRQEPATVLRPAFWQIVQDTLKQIAREFFAFDRRCMKHLREQYFQCLKIT
jgi:hypothetical protein